MRGTEDLESNLNKETRHRMLTRQRAWLLPKWNYAPPKCMLPQNYAMNIWQTEMFTRAHTILKWSSMSSQCPLQRERITNWCHKNSLIPPLLFILNFSCLKTVRYKMKRFEYYNFLFVTDSYSEICSGRSEGIGVQITSTEAHVIRHYWNSG